MRILIANLGTSDVYNKGKRVAEKQKEFMKKQLKDLTDVADKALTDAVAEDISLPLIEAALGKCGGKIDLFVAFVTDQPASVDQSLRDKDTIEVGRLVKYLYENNVGKFAGKVQEVRLEVISESQPNLYDEMLKLYPGRLNEIGEAVKELTSDSENEIFISVTAGTPACNLALLFASINALSIPGVKRYLYTSERNKEAEYLQAQTMIGRIEILNFIDRLIGRWDYDGVAKLVESTPGRSNKHLINMLAALESRLNFKFEDVDTKIGRSIFSYEGDIFKQLMEEVNTILEATKTIYTDKPVSSDRLFNELYWNMAIRYEIGNYLDFIGRFYLVVEDMQKLEACRINKCSVTGLKNGLDILTDQPSRKCLYDHIVRNRAKARPELLLWLKKANALIELRHKITHNMQGLSRREMRKQWDGDVLRDTREMLESYFGIEMVNPYTKYNDWLEKYCREVL